MVFNETENKFHGQQNKSFLVGVLSQYRDIYVEYLLSWSVKAETHSLRCDDKTAD